MEMDIPSWTIREKVAFGLGGIAIALRMASDWLFAAGGPLPYQLAQAALLGLAIVALWPGLEVIFVRGGNNHRGIGEGLVALPVGLVLGIGMAWLRFRGPQWPTPANTISPIANNLFFTAVEELEFRGFLLSFLLRMGLHSTSAVWLQAIVHTLAHIHRLWLGDYVSLVATLLVTLWLGSLTVRTRGIWGAWVGHFLFNMGTFLPSLGAGLNIR